MTFSSYSQDIESVFEDAIGPGGIERARFENLLIECDSVLARLRQDYKADSLPFARYAEKTDDLDGIRAAAKRIAAKAADVVILGIGGSSLGGQVLTGLAQDRFYIGQPGTPRLHFPDNPDPESFTRLLSVLDLEKTHFLAVSKSGSTGETLAQTLVVLDAFRVAGMESVIADHVTCLSQPGDNVLRRLAAKWNMPVIDHDATLGGRYSALSNVGLIPAAMAGVDVAGVRAGAASVWRPVVEGAAAVDIPAVIAAAIAIAGSEQGLRSTVLMPYADGLDSFVMWYRQLWAESLGKQGEGTTPIRALGPVDQHSQLQLYLDGPRDKLFTLMAPPQDGTGPRLDVSLAADDELEYMRGRTLGDLVAAECAATAETLAKNGRPVRRLRLAEIDAQVMGALMMHFMIETVVAAGLLRIDPFDQPAVEQGKVLTRDFLRGG